MLPGETWNDYQERLKRERAAGDPRVEDNPNAPAPSDRDQLSVSEIAHVRHVLGKHFFHDQPDVPDIAAGSAGFCPLCPAAVTTTYTDGTAVCGNGHRFPQQSVRQTT